jgi:hypothetical protein
MTNAELQQVLKTIADYSKQLELWASTIFAGSVLTILSTSYAKPKTLKGKLIYLIFIPSWLSVGISIYYSDYIQRLMLGSLFFDDKQEIIEAFYKMHDSFRLQQSCFYFALFSFGSWLLTYLAWWIFVEKPESSNN